MPTKITNKHGLPESIYNAVKFDNHLKTGDFSVTEIIDSPQIAYLKRNNTITEDVVDRVWALFGSAVHHILERSDVESYHARQILETSRILLNKATNGDPNSETIGKVVKWLQGYVKKEFPQAFDSKIWNEKHFKISISDSTLSGTVDRVDLGKSMMEDYKVVKTWTYIYPDAFKKYAIQQNIYRYMLWKEEGISLEKLNLIAIFKDFAPAKVKVVKGYPQQPIISVPLKVVPFDRVEAYLEKRVKIFEDAFYNGNIPECSETDKWAEAGIWKVLKKGRKKSFRNLPDKELADQFIKANELKHSGLYTEYFPGQNKRCEEYCSVRDICKQRKRETQQRYEEVQ